MRHTIIDLARATPAKVFATVVTGLAAQGFERAVSTRGHCRYRGVKGRKCAGGVLLRDESPLLRLEQRGLTVGWFGLVVYSHKTVPSMKGWVPLPFYHELLIRTLQGIHDDATSPQGMQDSLRALGRQLGFPDHPKL